jgi:hypothetical protein
MRGASINLILSKMGGPALLGLFNKAESLSRMPNRLVTPPTGQTLFRAMSKVQSDLIDEVHVLPHDQPANGLHHPSLRACGGLPSH